MRVLVNMAAADPKLAQKFAEQSMRQLLRPAPVERLPADYAVFQKERAAGNIAQNVKYTDWKRENSRSGAANVSVSPILGQKEVARDLAGPVGDMAKASKEQAEGATGMVDTSHSIMRALDSGKVIAGPTAKWRIVGAQIAQMMGATGPDAMLETRAVIQGLAKLTLESRKKLAGQGQVTENEQKLLARAESGEIDEMTVPELRQIAQVSDRIGRRLYQKHAALLAKMRDDPAAQASLRYYEVDTPLPAPYKAPAKTPETSPMLPLQRGQTRDGYRFKGGDPADPKNWEKLK
jgi:hypothetical protein